jgi:SH3 domain-containing YSC84-like protein 1
MRVGLTACVTCVIGVVTVVPAVAELSTKATNRIRSAATILKEIHSVPEKDIPQELWDKAECVIVVPALKKAAFVFGGEYGSGLMSCRPNGQWGSPVFMQIGKGSWGLQIGAQSIDLILLVMNTRGMEKLLGNKVSLGAEASVAAGPVGRDARAATDAQMQAEILSYSRTQGLFAGINLSGGVVKPDTDDNADLYGKGISAREVVLGNKTQPPEATQPFMSALQARATRSLPSQIVRSSQAGKTRGGPLARPIIAFNPPRCYSFQLISTPPVCSTFIDSAGLPMARFGRSVNACTGGPS